MRFLTLLTALCAACGGSTLAAATESTCPSGSALRYDSFGRPFLEKHCTPCHSSTLLGAARSSAPVGLDFDTVAGVRAVSARVDLKAAAGATQVNRLMPPREPRPTDDERRKLGEWLACGAPE